MSDAATADAGFLACRHLLLCRTAWVNPDDPDSGCSLGRILVHLRPPPGEEIPFTLNFMFAFFQLFGEPGEYLVELDRVRIDRNEFGEEEEDDSMTFGTRPILVADEDFVESYVFKLTNVPFDNAGVYEFRLRLHLPGDMVTLGTERIEVREST